MRKGAVLHKRRLNAPCLVPSVRRSCPKLLGKALAAQEIAFRNCSCAELLTGKRFKKHRRRRGPRRYLSQHFQAFYAVNKKIPQPLGRSTVRRICWKAPPQGNTSFREVLPQRGVVSRGISFSRNEKAASLSSDASVLRFHLPARCAVGFHPVGCGRR